MHGTLQEARPGELTFSSLLLTAREPEAISFIVMLRILLGGRRTILFSGLAALLLTVILAYLLPKTYTATASFVSPGSNTGSSASAAIMGQLSALGGGGLLSGKAKAILMWVFSRAARLPNSSSSASI